MDNAPIHTPNSIQDVIIESDNISFYIPPYSPYFNLTENVISIIKNKQRQNRVSTLFKSVIIIVDAYTEITSNMLTNIYTRFFRNKSKHPYFEVDSLYTNLYYNT
jgi:transposase